jgi:Rrf2 family protein
MFRLSRKTEYGLLALSHLRAAAPDEPCSAKDIAAHNHLSPSLLAKVMQRLKHAGLVDSVKGTTGGYCLASDLQNMSFLEFIHLFEEDTALVECLTNPSESSCQQVHTCGIRNPIIALNEAILDQFRALKLSELMQPLPTSGMLVSLDSLSR